MEKEQLLQMVAMYKKKCSDQEEQNMIYKIMINNLSEQLKLAKQEKECVEKLLNQYIEEDGVKREENIE